MATSSWQKASQTRCDSLCIHHHPHSSIMLGWKRLYEPYQRFSQWYTLGPVAYSKPQHQYCYVGEIAAVLTEGDAQPTEPILTTVDTDGTISNVYCIGPCTFTGSEWQVGHTVALLNAKRVDVQDAQPNAPKLVTVQSPQHILYLPCGLSTVRQVSDKLPLVLSFAANFCCSKCADVLDNASTDDLRDHRH